VLVACVVAWRMGNVFGAAVLSFLGLLGGWSLATFPLRFSVGESGITVWRPTGSTSIGWASIHRLTRMPGAHRLAHDEHGRRTMRRRRGALVAIVGRRRVVLLAHPEDQQLRDAVIEGARRNGVSLSPNV
jgi:hypothetical protein